MVAGTAENSHFKPQPGGNGKFLLKPTSLSPLPPWHTSSNNSTPCNHSQTFLSTEPSIQTWACGSHCKPTTTCTICPSPSPHLELPLHLCILPLYHQYPPFSLWLPTWSLLLPWFLQVLQVVYSQLKTWIQETQMSKNMCHWSFCVCVTSVNIIFFRSVWIKAISWFHFSLHLNSIPLCTLAHFH